MSDFTAYNQKVIAEFRANGGKVADFGDSPLVILHTTGARTGEERLNPLIYLADGDRVVVFASMAGAPRNPDWYHNLTANPQVTLELGDETRRGVAAEVTGPERDRLYDEQARRVPAFEEYRQKTTRVIPVVAVAPAS